MNWMRYRLIYTLVSLSVIVSGLASLFIWGIPLGIDFTGGVVAEYKLQGDVSTEKISEKLKSDGIEISSIQKTEGGSYLFKLLNLDPEQKIKFKDGLKSITSSDPEELRYEEVGPTIGPELIKKTIYAMIIASIAILLWVAFQFKSIKFGASAILAMIHDSLVLIGIFLILGHFFDAEVDFLFVTAMLTVLSFSVHDTIVVYDRIRENQKKIGGDLGDLANRAVTETMVRSLNNSLTIIFMLVALVLLGGATIKWFAVALLIGTISGTYSSPFVAVPLLVTIDEIVQKIKKGR